MTAPDPHEPAHRLLLLLLPMLLAVVALWPALDNGFTNWDDPLFLLRNDLTRAPLAHGLSGLLVPARLGYPIPLTILAYAGQRACFDLNPAGYHAVSLVLHLLVVGAAALLARRLGCRWRGTLAAAALLAVHPVVAEPVAWVVGQKDLLATGFLLAALVVRAGARGDRAGATLLVALLATCSIAAKPSAVALPLLLVGVDAIRRRDLRARANLALYGAVTALAVLSAMLTVWKHDALGVSPTGHFGAGSIVAAAWAFTLEVGHLVWPHPLLARYFPPGGAELATSAALGVVLAAGAVAGAVLAWRRGHRAVGFGIGGALLAYAPASGLLPITRGPADSYLYLPLALAVVPLAVGLDRLLAADHRRRAAASATALALVLGAATLATRAQARVWRNAPTLWTAVAEAYPDEPRALMRVGDAYLFVNRPDVALAVFDELHRDHPDFATSALSHAVALQLLGRFRDAEAVLAAGARRAGTPRFLDDYGFFLIGHPELAPSDPETACAALNQIAPTLAARGKRPAGLRRAIELARDCSAHDQQAALERRLQEILARPPPR